jgi:hypothetical protein
LLTWFSVVVRRGPCGPLIESTVLRSRILLHRGDLHYDSVVIRRLQLCIELLFRSLDNFQRCRAVVNTWYVVAALYLASSSDTASFAS